MSETTADVCQKCKKPICLTGRTIGGYPLVPGVWCECGAVNKDVCPRCGGSGVPVAADGNRFHCINGHAWGLEVEQPADDPIEHPPHYTAGNIECIDCIAAATAGLVGMEAVCVGNIIRYLYRLRRKNTPQENAAKAMWYMRRLVETVEGK